MNNRDLSSLPQTTFSKEKMGISWLIAATVTTIVLWQFSWGNYILYPFSILATWFHEMGHGLTAMLLGGNFQKLVLFSNGSGVAYHSGHLFLGRIGRALVSAGGLLGPAIAGSLFIISSRRYKTAHYTLMFLGCFLLISVLLWVRSFFGIIAITLWGLGIIYLSYKTDKEVQGFAIQFLGVQAIISCYHQIGYLFMNNAVINGRYMTSDTGQIAKQLFLPHWFWAILIIIATILLLFYSLRIAYFDEYKIYSKKRDNDI
ncbi:M50 family metallopeptidase [Geminocystis sp. NIES-3709]|uniref:M50 family metallopeptidase n=1 Tax=Geminocystis sp. NIES-3709 TaxID=1617448 RepID=UPI0005FCB1A5|nr:M50 family metallopeptidase [Geminocystis sp. NIES-3709]BAQ65817.1 hypothetical protein GM3709_2582 [Geminocystis sp. NIES-3709]